MTFQDLIDNIRTCDEVLASNVNDEELCNSYSKLRDYYLSVIESEFSEQYDELIFEPKMSGVRVTNFTIKRVFKNQFISLAEVMEKIHRQETMDYILDTFRFSKGSNGKDWYMIIDSDTDCKISIMENYPNYERQMIQYFGEEWLKYYIRFNH